MARDNASAAELARRVADAGTEVQIGYPRREVHGSKDSVAAGLGPRLPLRSAEPGVPFPDGTPYVFFMDRFADAFRAELAAFTEVVAGRHTSPCTVADALETGWIAEACTLSLREHRPVLVDEVRLP